jgi:uncharacterized protein (DUF58 family)
MIVPRNRLVTGTALALVPLGLVAAADPDAIPTVAAFAAACAVVALLDALLALGALDGIAIAIPKITRLFKDRPAAIELEITNNRLKTRELRVALVLPPGLLSDQEDLRAALPENDPVSKLAWPCLPTRRGNYALDACCVEAASPLKLWVVRNRLPIQGEARVYPNLFQDRRAVAALFLNRGNFGAHAQRQVGKGREFEKIREYLPGDSFDEIHWKATAKRNRPVTKVFQIERTQEVYVIIDASRLSARAQTPIAGPEKDATPDPILERFLTAGLILGAAAERQGDHFGLMAFDDRVRAFVRAKSGKAHYAACRDALYTLQPRPVSPDFDEVGAFIRLRLRRRALLVFLTSLEDPILAESFSRNMNLLCRQHLILVNMMQPPGAAPLFAAPDAASIDGLYQRLGGHLVWNRLRELERSLSHRGVRFSSVANEKLSAELITQYMSVKRRQLL